MERTTPAAIAEHFSVLTDPRMAGKTRNERIKPRLFI
jgi:hypothetical protein